MTAEQFDVSVVIVSFNTRDLLRECLNTLAAEAGGVRYEVIVVDNASADGTVEMIVAEFPEVQVVQNATNVGFSPANNQGIASSKAPFILLLNSDTVVQKDSIVQWMKVHVDSGATVSGPRLLNTDGSLQRSAWKVPGILGQLLELFYLHRVSGIGGYSDEQYTQDFEPGFVSGAAMLFARELSDRIGGLDPEMFWMEDVDFCVRARKEGGTVKYLHLPEIVHIGGQSSKKNLGRVISNQLISRIKFMRKHGDVLRSTLLVLIILLHVLTRMVIFGILSIFGDEPKAKAYSYTLRKLFRYLFAGDRSI